MRSIATAAVVFALPVIAAGALLLSGLVPSQAAQDPSLALDPATPTATACPGCTPTATATATPTRTPTATPTFCPDCTPSTEVTFVNETAQAASELHIEFPMEGSTSTAGVVQNAPGCPSPAVHSTPPIDNHVTVDWGVACVDPGESVRLFFGADSPFGPKPQVSCFYWTRLGAFIEGQSPPCAETFVNDTGQAASDLHIVFTPDEPPISVGLVQNAPGCPSPTYSIASNVVGVDWGVACVDPGESAAFVFIPRDSARHQPAVSSFSWNTSTPTSTPSPTPTPSPSPTPVSRTFVVNTTTEAADANPGDNLCRTSAGTCSLQAAFQEANRVSGRDTINFSIGSGPQRIMQTSAGQTYTAVDSLIIDGSTQPGFSGTPLIEIDSSNVGPSVAGLRLQGASNSTIRELAIVGSGFFGIYSTSSNNTLEGNYIGQRIDGTAAGNFEGGIYIAGSNNTIRDNLIANNGGSSNNYDGVSIAGGLDNLIQGNRIFNNVRLGIDLGPDGVTPNDTGDGDAGANDRQNFPVIESATLFGGPPFTMNISGRLNSRPNTTYTLEFFQNTACDSSNFGEGERFLGSETVTTNSSGDAFFSTSFPQSSPPSPPGFVSATATDPTGNTSEFAQCLFVATGNPTPTASPSPSPTPTATPTPAPDSDGDGVPDAGDNCPNWANPAQDLPPWPVPADDPDCDGFSTVVEDSAGTHPFAHCGADAWPADINNDTFVDVTGDIGQWAGLFGQTVPPAPARYDIAPDPPNGYIDVIGDISRLTALFAQSCA